MPPSVHRITFYLFNYVSHLIEVHRMQGCSLNKTILIDLKICLHNISWLVLLNLAFTVIYLFMIVPISDDILRYLPPCSTNRSIYTVEVSVQVFWSCTRVSLASLILPRGAYTFTLKIKIKRKLKKLFFDPFR